MNTTPQQLGEILALTIESQRLGTSYENLLQKKASWEAAMSDEQSQKTLAAIGALIMKSAGYEDSMEHALFETLYNTEGPIMKANADRFLGPVAETLTKEAGIMDAVGTAADLGIKGTKLAALLAIGLGATGGGAYWALNRAIRQDDAEVEAKEEQAKHYRRVAHDLKRRMALEKEVRTGITTKAIEDETGAYVL